MVLGHYLGMLNPWVVLGSFKVAAGLRSHALAVITLNVRLYSLGRRGLT